MPSSILYNGTIYTLDPSLPRAQALGIRDGRVVAIGSEGKVQAAMGGRAELINLRGRSVVPALTDAHVHFVNYALARRTLRMDGVADFDTALEWSATAIPIASFSQDYREGIRAFVEKRDAKFTGR